ncbi:hypothetical protein ANRL3_02070 [Anaerolineae bacterium]|nr:hypothetical protein ANRL3_02070 [Anaerolineae bacterium]
MTLTLMQIEATGIQDDVFGSNNLRQNVGASERVMRATTEWLVEGLRLAGLAANARWDDQEFTLALDGRTLADGIQAQVIYTGGGNALVLFKGTQDTSAKSFTQKFTRLTLQRARGLPLVVEFCEFDETQVALADAHRRVREQAAVRKLDRVNDVPLLGLGVSAACDFTGLPAVDRDYDRRLASQMVMDKLAGFQDADKRLHHLLPIRPKFEFVYDFDQFGERGESSYLAVIHADGNRMSTRFDEIGSAFKRIEENAAYARALFRLSQAIATESLRALKAMTDMLIHSFDDNEKRFGRNVPARKKEGHQKDAPWLLPFRPIVFGGDDVTFVAEGRFGLALAARYLQSLAEKKLPAPLENEWGDPFYARAGVAIVKAHYPFSRAYELADDLAASAKRKIGDLTPTGKGSVMDWHLSTSGVVLPLDQVRAREYAANNGNSLLIRPVRLNLGTQLTESKYWRSWENFDSVTRAFQTDWADRRNKVKALRDALRQGTTAVQQFRINYKEKLLPPIEGQSQMPETGWSGADCGYFDPIEAMDYYDPLDAKEQNG